MAALSFTTHLTSDIIIYINPANSHTAEISPQFVRLIASVPFGIPRPRPALYLNSDYPVPVLFLVTDTYDRFRVLES